MKLFLSILLFCFVSVSYQENNVRPPVPYARQSRARYVPLFYANGVPAGYDFIDDKKVYTFCFPIIFQQFGCIC